MNSLARQRLPPDGLLASILTPPGQGAVATVRVDGLAAVATVDRLFQPAGGRPWRHDRMGRIFYGRWREAAGEEVVVLRLNDHSVEIHCHGGSTAAAAIIDDLKAQGAAVTDWRQWSASQDVDPLRAAARIALAEAPSARTAAILLDQYEGALRRELDALRAALSADDLPKAGQQIDRLLAHRRTGLHLTTPFRVVLAGRPNVGKSSLINRLVGFQRAIVFDSPGTTRDVVRVGTCLDGWPVELADTAGLRDAGDPLEAAGVDRARALLATADLVVLVFDASAAWTAEDAELTRRYTDGLIIHNKCDLLPAASAGRPQGLYVSAKTGAGIETLISAIAGRLVPRPPPPGAPVPFTSGQYDVLDRTLAAARTGNRGAASVTLS